MKSTLAESGRVRFIHQCVVSHLPAGLVLLLATGACFYQIFLHPSDLLVGVQDGGQNDVTRQILAFRSFQQIAFSQFSQWPLWNPFGLTGIPWLGNPQSGLFYPPNWLFLCFDASVVVTWLLIGHHFLAGLGTYFLGLRYGFHRWAAVFGGVAFLGAPYYIANTGEGHFNPVCLMAWVPWAFLCYESIRTGSKAACAGLGILFALCFFCGHVQELFYLVLILSAYVLCDCLCGKQSGRTISARQLLGRWVFLGGITAGLVAIDLLPIYIYTNQATRSGGITVAEASANSLETLSLLQLLDPFTLGGPDQFELPNKFYWETLAFFGVGVSLLAVLGVALGARLYSVPRLFGLLIVSFLFAFGDSLPIFPLMHRFVPGISFFRAPSRALFFSSFAVSLLAAAGVHAVISVSQSKDLNQKKRLLRTVSALAFFFSVVLGALFVLRSMHASTENVTGSVTFASAVQSMQLVSVLCWGLSLFAILFGMIKFQRFSSQFAATLICLTVLELSLHAQGILTRIPHDIIRPDHSLVDDLNASEEVGRVLVAQDHLSDREAWNASIAKVQGYDPVPLSRFGLYLAALVFPRDPSLELTGFDAINLSFYNPNLLDLLGVSHVVLLPNQKVDQECWQVVSQEIVKQKFTSVIAKQRVFPYRLFKKRNPFPRAFVLGDTQQLDMQNEVVEQLRAFDPRKTVLVEHDVLPAGKRQSFQSATIREYTPNRITIEAELTDPGYLVLSDIYYPGWSATVDESPSVVLPANFAFRAVPLEPGKHVVQFEFEPPGLKLGIILSCGAFCILILWLCMGSNRKTVANQHQSEELESDQPPESANQTTNRLPTFTS